MRARAWNLIKSPAWGLTRRTGHVLNSSAYQARYFNGLSATFTAKNTDDLLDLSLFPTIRHPKGQEQSTENTAVLLFTKAYAQVLVSNANYLKDFVRRLLPWDTFTQSTHHTLEVAIAVVDSLPITSSTESQGAEGFCFLVADKNNLKLEPIQDEEEHTIKIPHISWTIPAAQSTNVTIRSPIASTIFENGMDSTFLYTTWTCHKSTLACTAAKHVRHVKATLSNTSDVQKSSKFHLHLPASPLTGIFKIKESLGNVLRELESLATGEATPASGELTNAITAQSLKAGQVFAVISPIVPETDNLLSSDLQDVLKKGHIIRRVTGGGGEWGNKAALITLDDRSIFNDDPIELRDDSEDMTFPWLQQLSIAPPGHCVQFFQVDHQISSTEPRNSGNSPIGRFSFGCIPEDNVAIFSSTLESSHDVSSNQFGCLTVSGIGFSTDLKAQNYIDIPHTSITYEYALNDAASSSQRNLSTKTSTIGTVEFDAEALNSKIRSSNHIVRSHLPGNVTDGQDENPMRSRSQKAFGVRRLGSLGVRRVNSESPITKHDSVDLEAEIPSKADSDLLIKPNTWPRLSVLEKNDSQLLLTKHEVLAPTEEKPQAAKFKDKSNPRTSHEMSDLEGENSELRILKSIRRDTQPDDYTEGSIRKTELRPGLSDVEDDSSGPRIYGRFALKHKTRSSKRSAGRKNPSRMVLVKQIQRQAPATEVIEGQRVGDEKSASVASLNPGSPIEHHETREEEQKPIVRLVKNKGSTRLETQLVDQLDLLFAAFPIKPEVLFQKETPKIRRRPSYNRSDVQNPLEMLKQMQNVHIHAHPK